MASGLLKRSLSFIKSFGNRNNAVNGPAVLKKGNRNRNQNRYVPGCMGWGMDWEEEYKALYTPMILFQSPQEIRFRVPAHPDLNASQIRMKVDTHNRFVLASQYPKIPYLQFLYLPKDANFEKAVFKIKFELEAAHVTVTNFKKDEVVVEFNS